MELRPSISEKPQHPLRGYFYIAAATFCWGVSATLGRAVFTGRLQLPGPPLGSIGPLILSQARTTLSLLFLFPILAAQRGWQGLKIQRRDAFRMALIGIFGVAAANYFYYLSIQKTTVATAITVQYTAPIWVLVYMVSRRLQRPTLQKVAAVLLAVIGIAIAIGIFSTSKTPLNAVGVIAALLAAFAYAFYNIAGHRVMELHDHWTVMLYMLLAASVFWLLLNPPWKIIAAHYSGTQWLFLALFSLISMLLPFSLYFAGLRYLEPTQAIVTSCLEPICAILIAAIALGETVYAMQVLGMAMVLAAIVAVQLPDSGKTAKSQH